MSIIRLDSSLLIDRKCFVAAAIETLGEDVYLNLYLQGLHEPIVLYNSHNIKHIDQVTATENALHILDNIHLALNKAEKQTETGVDEEDEQTRVEIHEDDEQEEE